MNKTIKLLMISDIFVLTGFGLIEPILAIFIKENLIGGTIFGAGIASTIFLLTKCTVQLPFSKYVDKHDDKVKWLFFGTLMIALVPFIYISATNINSIYIAQFLYGLGSGLAYPTWLGLWSTNLDRKQESYEWSLYSTLSGIGTALTAMIGATIAQFIGFRLTFVIVGVFSLTGCSILLALEKKENNNKSKNIHYHKKRKLIHKKYH